MTTTIPKPGGSQSRRLKYTRRYRRVEPTQTDSRAIRKAVLVIAGPNTKAPAASTPPILSGPAVSVAVAGQVRQGNQGCHWSMFCGTPRCK